MQLEKIGITDKTISKGGGGIAMPDASVIIELCDIISISVNELLNCKKGVIVNLVINY